MESGLYVRCMGKVPRVPFLLAHSLEFTAKGNQDMQDDRQPSLSNGKWVAFWKIAMSYQEKDVCLWQMRVVLYRRWPFDTAL